MNTTVEPTRFALLARLLMSGVIKAWVYLTHWLMHFDEHVSYEMLCDAGKEIFPGIDKNPIRYNRGACELIDGKNAEQLTEEGYLIVGTLGSPLDEHGRRGRTALRGHSSCSLVLAFLEGRVSEERLGAWRRIVAAATLDDNEGSKNILSMGKMIQAMKRFNPTSPEAVCRWTRVGLHAARDAERRRAKGEKRELRKDSLLCAGENDPADKALEIWLNWRYNHDKFSSRVQSLVDSQFLRLITGEQRGIRLERADTGLLNTRGSNLTRSVMRRGLEQVAGIKRLCGDALKDKITIVSSGGTSEMQVNILHFRQIIHDMVWRGDKASDILAWAFKAFDARVREAVAYISAQAELKTNESVESHVIGTGERQINVMTLESDSEAIGGAANGGDDAPDVRIQMRPTGGALIAINKSSHNAKLLGKMLPVMQGKIRRLECEVRRIDPGNQDLTFDGCSEDLPWWFYHEGLAMIMNRSESYPDVEPTKLCVEDLFQCLCEAWEEACAIAA